MEKAHIVQKRLPWGVRKANAAPPETKRETPALILRINKCTHEKMSPKSRRVLWGNLATQVIANRVELNAEDLCSVVICFAKPHIAPFVPVSAIDQVIESLSRSVSAPPPALAKVLPAVEFLRPEMSADIKARLVQLLVGQCAELSFADLCDVTIGVSNLQDRRSLSENFVEELVEALSARLEFDSIDPVKCFLLPRAVMALGRVDQPAVRRVMTLLADFIQCAITSRLNVKLRDALNCCDTFGGPYKALGRKLLMYCEEELKLLTDEQLVGMDRSIGERLVRAELIRRGLDG